MKIIAINGSPHGAKGTTGLLLSEATKAAQTAGAKVTTLVVSDYQVGPCRACDVCHRTGVCPIKDDFARFKEALLAADAIILASPNYLTSVSAQLKAVMDRCCGLLHCQALRGKHAAAIVTSGGGGTEQVQEYLLEFLRNMGSWTVGSAGATAATLANPATSPAALQAAWAAQYKANVRPDTWTWGDDLGSDPYGHSATRRRGTRSLTTGLGSTTNDSHETTPVRSSGLSMQDLSAACVPEEWVEQLEAMEPADREAILDELAAREDLWAAAGYYG